MRRSLCFLLAACALGLAACDSDIKNAVRQTIADPASAQFRNISQCPKNRAIFYGEVNSKNAFGAYDGYKPFYYVDGRVEYAQNGNFTELIERCFSNTDPLNSGRDNELSAVDPLPKMAGAEHRVDDNSVATSSREAAANDQHAPMELTTNEEAADSPAPNEECWQDYCPCEVGPDYGGPDIAICRNIHGGIPVSDREFSLGAMMRDARKQLRESREENPEF